MKRGSVSVIVSTLMLVLAVAISGSYLINADTIITGKQTQLFNDDDNDGISNDKDNCPNARNPEQEDADNNNVGNGCDPCFLNPWIEAYWSTGNSTFLLTSQVKEQIVAVARTNASCSGNWVNFTVYNTETNIFLENQPPLRPLIAKIAVGPWAPTNSGTYYFIATMVNNPNATITSRNIVVTPTPCTQDEGCNDNNSCTVDVCNLQTEQCEFSENTDCQELPLPNQTNITPQVEHPSKPQTEQTSKPLAEPTITREPIKKTFVQIIVEFFTGIFGFFTTEELKEVSPLDFQAKAERIDLIEKKGKKDSITGAFEIVHADDFDNEISEFVFFLIEEQTKERYRIFEPENSHLENRLNTGSKIKIQGKKIGKEIVLSNYEILENDSHATSKKQEEGYFSTANEHLSLSPNEVNLGEQKTFVVLVNFLNNQSQPLTAEEAWHRVFNTTGEQYSNSLNRFVMENSFGKAFHDGDVYPSWVTVPVNLGDQCDVYNEIIEIVDPNVDFVAENYTRIIIVYNVRNPACFGVGSGTIGLTTRQTDDGEIQVSIATTTLYNVSSIDATVIYHELGHNFGNRHANYLDCGQETITEDFNFDCNYQEYGDKFDVMGSSRGRHFNAYHKEIIGWLDPENINETLEWGTYFIEPIEIPGTSIKTLKIPRQDDLTYSIEYRRLIGFDSYFNSTNLYTNDIFDGALIHLNFNNHFGGDTQQIDMTPDNSYSNYHADSVLRPGQTFYDPENDIVITTKSFTDQLLEVYLGKENCGDNLVQFGEQCDLSNLSDTTCPDLGFNTGTLNCSSDCTFNTSQCTEPLCAPGHEYMGNGICKAEFNSHVQGGYVRSEGSDWSNVRADASGTFSDSTGTVLSVRMRSGWPSSPRVSIYRSSVPFDTGQIPDSAQIISADLHFHKATENPVNTHPNSNDSIIFVKTSLENPPFLTNQDFDEIGNIDNPIEIANRFDISQEAGTSRNTKVNRTLNQQGLDSISKTNFTLFGLRTGYDLYSQEPNNGAQTQIVASLWSLENVFGYRLAPKLIVHYLGQSGQAQCGNGILEPGEQCDDSNTNPGDGCSSICSTEQGECGNGIVEGSEECDDGNAVPGDGCSAICTNETATQTCGNGVVEGTEECDDGNLVLGDGCDAQCFLQQFIECGNGIPEPEEQCDDGNTNNGDGCSSSCQNEGIENPGTTGTPGAGGGTPGGTTTGNTTRGQCVPQWSCSSWSQCVAGSQTRICTDSNNCGTGEGKPSQSQDCELALNQNQNDSINQTIPSTLAHLPTKTIAITGSLAGIAVITAILIAFITRNTRSKRRARLQHRHEYIFELIKRIEESLDNQEKARQAYLKLKEKVEENASSLTQRDRKDIKSEALRLYRFIQKKSREK